MMSGNDLVLGANGEGEGRMGRWFKDGMDVHEAVLGEGEF